MGFSDTLARNIAGVRRAAGDAAPAYNSPVSIGFNVGDLPDEPQYWDLKKPLGESRMGLDVYRRMWAAYPKDVQRYISMLYGWADVCVSILAEDAAKLERKAFKVKPVKGVLEEIEQPWDFWANRLVNNPDQGVIAKNAHTQLLMRWLLSTGMGIEFTPVWTKEESDKYATTDTQLWSYPAALKIMELERIYLILDPDLVVQLVVYMSNSGPRYFMPYEVCRIARLYPNNDPIRHILWGEGAIEHAMKSISSSAAMQEYIEQYCRNFGAPAVIVTKPRGEWTEEEKRNFDFQWQKKYRQKGGLVGYASGNLTITTLDTSSAQSNLYKVNEQAAEEVCAHFRIRLSMVLGKYQNKAVSETVHEDHIEGPLRNWITLRDEAETMYLQMYDPNVIVKTILPTSDEREFDMKMDLQALQTGQATPNEIARKNGYAGKNPDGDTYYMLSTYRRADAIANPPASAGGQLALRGRAARLRRVSGDGSGRDAENTDEDGFDTNDPDYAVIRALQDSHAKYSGRITHAVAGVYEQVRKDVIARVPEEVRA